MFKNNKFWIAILISLVILLTSIIFLFFYFISSKNKNSDKNEIETIEPTNETEDENTETDDTEENEEIDVNDIEEELSNTSFEISVKNYDVEQTDTAIAVKENKNPSFIPVEVKLKSENEILFLADEQNILADLSDAYLLELVKKGATLASNSKSLYDFSKENFSANNIEEFDYNTKMENSSERNPVKLSAMAKAKVGYCIEQSIFRGLSYAYAGTPMKIVIMYPSQDNEEDFGHATVKSLSQTPKDIIQDFVDSGVYSWEIRYFEEIVIEKIN